MEYFNNISTTKTILVILKLPPPSTWLDLGSKMCDEIVPNFRCSERLVLSHISITAVVYGFVFSHNAYGISNPQKESLRRWYTPRAQVKNLESLNQPPRHVTSLICIWREILEKTTINCPLRCRKRYSICYNTEEIFLHKPTWSVEWPLYFHVKNAFFRNS